MRRHYTPDPADFLAWQAACDALRARQAQEAPRPAEPLPWLVPAWTVRDGAWLAVEE